jgi:16S rRNA (adenine1518-N6/adenine1519-N6)-dimethyltransferase
MSTYGKRRALGQHFLKDLGVIQKIVGKTLEEAVLNQCTVLLEIGPGKGALTLPLLESLKTQGLHQKNSVQRLLIVEKDEGFAEFWVAHGRSNWSAGADLTLTVQKGDFMDLPENLLFGHGKMGVVSNLPYSAGTAILNRLARQGATIPFMILMFQAEVAQRLRAEEATKGRGSLSVWIQNLWNVNHFLDVHPKAFLPPPEVNSEVLCFQRRSSPRVDGTTDPEGERLWETLLKTCFAQKRKMLRSILNSQRVWQNTLELSGVDGTKRAEALQWQEWNQLFQAAKQNLNRSP